MMCWSLVMEWFLYCLLPLNVERMWLSQIFHWWYWNLVKSDGRKHNQSNRRIKKKQWQINKTNTKYGNKTNIDVLYYSKSRGKYNVLYFWQKRSINTVITWWICIHLTYTNLFTYIVCMHCDIETIIHVEYSINTLLLLYTIILY